MGWGSSVAVSYAVGHSALKWSKNILFVPDGITSFLFLFYFIFRKRWGSNRFVSLKTTFLVCWDTQGQWWFGDLSRSWHTTLNATLNPGNLSSPRQTKPILFYSDLPFPSWVNASYLHPTLLIGVFIRGYFLLTYPRNTPGAGMAREARPCPCSQGITASNQESCLLSSPGEKVLVLQWLKQRQRVSRASDGTDAWDGNRVFSANGSLEEIQTWEDGLTCSVQRFHKENGVIHALIRDPSFVSQVWCLCAYYRECRERCVKCKGNDW